MSCIHGLDYNNCPICRISKSTIPNTPIAKKAVKIENLRPENPFFKNHIENKKQSEKYLTKNKILLSPNLINPLPVPKLITKIPNFENNDLMKKLDEFDLKGFDTHGISKRINLESPTVKLDDE